MSASIVRQIKGEDAMVAAGEALGRALKAGGVVFFHGDLGSGKTTMCRGVLRAWGHRGAVKSPTYTLVEPYRYRGTDLYHFDLYRLGDPEELDYIGIRDYFEQDNVCLVEWPEKGEGALPEADLDIFLSGEGDQRQVRLASSSPRGDRITGSLREACVSNG